MQKTTWWAIVIMLLCTVFTAFGQMFMKLGSGHYFDLIALILSQDIAVTLSTVFSNPILTSGFFIGIGISFYVIGAVLNIISLKGGELSVLFPVFATNYIWVQFLAAFALNEPMNTFKWVGVLGIVIGISLIGYGSEKMYKKENKTKKSKKRKA
jgi:drug/metabolite transporter (DMT)-like permease